MPANNVGKQCPKVAIGVVKKIIIFYVHKISVYNAFKYFNPKHIKIQIEINKKGKSKYK